jgi:hypothetical protein
MATRRRKVTVETTGRTDLDNFFEKSDVLDVKLTHYPLIAFLADGDAVRVQVLERATAVQGLPADTAMMAQWGGRWRSDFFRFTAGDVQEALARRERIEAKRKLIPGYDPAFRAARRLLEMGHDYDLKRTQPERCAQWLREAEVLAQADPEEDARVVLAAAGLERA